MISQGCLASVIKNVLVQDDWLGEGAVQKGHLLLCVCFVYCIL